MKGKRKVYLVKRTGGWCEPVQGIFRSALEWVAMSNNGDSVIITRGSQFILANKGGNAGTSRP